MSLSLYRMQKSTVALDCRQYVSQENTDRYTSVEKIGAVESSGLAGGPLRSSSIVWIALERDGLNDRIGHKEDAIFR